MRRKYLPIAMAIMMSTALLTGCSLNLSNTAISTTSASGSSTSSNATSVSDASQASDAIYGEVTKVDDDGITIEVGTMKEMSDKKTDNNSSSKSNSSDDSSKDSASASDSSDDSSKDSTSASGSDSSGNSSKDSASASGSSDDSSKNSASGSDGKAGGEKPSMIEKTGETQEISVGSNTQITKQSMGQPGQGGDNKPGEAPEKPGNSSSDNNTKSTDNSNSSNSATSSDGSSSDNSATSSDSSNSNDSTKPADSSSSNNDTKSVEEISLSDISEGDIVAVTLDDDGNAAIITVVMSQGGGQAPDNGNNNGGGGNGGGNSQAQAPTSYSSNTEYKEDTTASNKEISSTGTDENAVLASSGAKVNLSNFTITRNSSESQGGDASSFYGIGASVLETDGTLFLKNSTITSNAKGAAGIFAYGDGTVYTADTKITTSQDTSGGIHAAGGGTLYAWDMDVETSGTSSAAIRSDRGGGKMVVNGGTYTSNGTDSPAIYSTADIAVNNAKLTANSSEAICIEGLNSIHLFDSDLTGNMSDDERNDCAWNVILYQSMSGDSEVGNSTFEMNGGSLTAKNGGMFYTTNTESTFVLSDVDITYADDNDFFLKCTGNSNQRSWGTTGSNGADCNFTAIKQDMQGDIIWDSISNLDFYMTDNSTLKGAVTQDESNAGDGGDGYCNIYIEKGSTWTVTGDSTVTSLQNAGTIVDEDGKTVTIKGIDGTVYVEGDSEYTVTVNSYKDSTDTSGATAQTSWSDYEVEKPSEL